MENVRQCRLVEYTPEVVAHFEVVLEHDEPVGSHSQIVLARILCLID